jgi:prevent-host-death family protein
METINIHDAKTQFSRLVDEASTGKEIVIAKAGRPTARLVPLAPQNQPARRFGGLKGKIQIFDDFNEPLPDAVLDAFEGK